MNKKGEGVTLALVVMLGLAIISLPLMTPRFRRQKCVQKCVALGNPQEACVSMVNDFSKAELLKYYPKDK